ncbi:Rap1a/Tai family immunity protein [Comamonas thiooxydans]|uniref:Rap1a/Tai family immunity protein n=1 Tax=Comamonas thiooxydans TaxID=363952 RepID=UPI0021143612|nr:Rap1a/Tai family immunity protein [Comamonas thiooxydans]UUE95334.1 hypothetical protein MJ608_06760 [Comamonas thiooxydans]
MNLRKIATYAMLLLAIEAQAQPRPAEIPPTPDSGAQLLNYCTQEPAGITFGYCLGSVRSIASLVFLNAAMQARDTAACEALLPQISGDQLRLVVVKFLQSNPEHLHMSGGLLVHTALNEFAQKLCPPKTKR